MNGSFHLHDREGTLLADLSLKVWIGKYVPIYWSGEGGRAVELTSTKPPKVCAACARASILGRHVTGTRNFLRGPVTCRCRTDPRVA